MNTNWLKSIYVRIDFRSKFWLIIIKIALIVAHPLSCLFPMVLRLMKQLKKMPERKNGFGVAALCVKMSMAVQKLITVLIVKSHIRNLIPSSTLIFLNKTHSQNQTMNPFSGLLLMKIKIMPMMRSLFLEIDKFYLTESMNILRVREMKSFMQKP